MHANVVYGSIISGTAAWTARIITYEELMDAIPSIFYGIKDPALIDKASQFLLELADLNSLYSAITALFPQPFYRYLFRNSFRDSRTSPICKKYREILIQTSKLRSNLDDISPAIRINQFYFEYLQFALDIVQALAEKDQIRIEINRGLKPFVNIKQGIILDGIKNNLIEKLNHKIIEFTNLKENYQRLWCAWAKFPNLEFGLEKFNSLIQSYETKKDEINQNIASSSPFLSSAYIWSEEKFSAPKVRYFRKIFQIDGTICNARIQIMVGNYGRLFVNGMLAGEIMSRNSLSILPISQSIPIFDITKFLQEGR